jgi:hypothetical protein
VRPGRRASFIAVIVALPSLLPSAPAQAQVVDFGLLSGRVMSTDGPVSGARVVVVPTDRTAGGNIETTATDGSYRVRAPAGTFTMIVIPPAPYAEEDVDLTAPHGADLFALAAGQTLTGVDVTVGSPASITGTVTAAGRPIEGVAVRAERVGGTVPFVAGPRFTVTGPDGTYRFDGLPIADQWVQFTPTGAALAPQFYDAQPSRLTANRVAVSAGATNSGVDAALTPSGAIAGVVLGPGGAVMPGAFLQISIDGNDTRFAQTGADGSFTVDGLAASGDWQIFTTPSTGSFAQASTTTVGVVADQTTAVTIRLPAGSQITGTVLTADGALYPNGMYFVMVCASPAVPVAWTRQGVRKCSDGSAPLSGVTRIVAAPLSFEFVHVALGPVNVAIDNGTLTGIASTTLTAGLASACTFRFGGVSECAGHDTTPPAISCPTISDVGLNRRDVVIEAPVDDDGVATTASAILATDTAGINTVEFVASDATGNVATVSCRYRVVYRFTGFVKPLKSDRQIKMTVGQQLRLEWRLLDGNGAAVTNASSFGGFSVTSHACPTAARQTTIHETSTFKVGYASLLSGNHRYVWTATRTSQRCATATVALGDGTRRSVEIKVVPTS